MLPKWWLYARISSRNAVRKLSAGVLLLHGNAPAHNSRTSWAAIRKRGFVELNHPPYSPDLAPSDYFIFRNLKKFLLVRRFPDDIAVKEAATGYFDTHDVSFLLSSDIRSEGSIAIVKKSTSIVYDF